MAGTIKAIQTHYKGYRFRSRLEARWAVFFDALGVKWEYEKQGYSLPSGPYLPDFWLPLQAGYQRTQFPRGCYWVEIKPVRPTEDEINLLMELTRVTGHNSFLVAGSVGDDDLTTYKASCIRDIQSLDYWIHDACPQLQTSAGELRHDDSGRFHPDDFAAALRCESDLSFPPFCEITSLTSRPYCDVYDAAVSAARSARFEHGETPRL